MVGLPVIANVQRVAFLWHQTNGPGTAVNVMHFSNPSTDLLSLKNLIDANVTTQMWLHAPVTCEIYQLDITPLDGSGATQSFTVTGTKWAGFVSSSEAVPAVAAIVKLTTAVRGRQNRGRIFLPFVAESQISNGIWTSPPTAGQTAWDTFRAAMKTGLKPMHVASYGHGYHKSGGHGAPIVYTPVTWSAHSNEVTASTLEVKFGTMRPRQSRLR